MVISVASQKGGTGKTSTSVSLAAGLAHKGKRVLLIDIDSQANSSKVLLRHYGEISKDQTIHHTILARAPLVVHETYVPNLSIVPSHILLSNTDIELTTAKDHRESFSKTAVTRLRVRSRSSSSSGLAQAKTFSANGYSRSFRSRWNVSRTRLRGIRCTMLSISWPCGSNTMTDSSCSSR